MTRRVRILDRLVGRGARHVPDRWLERPLVRHASLRRLPASMLTGALSSFERLCGVYQGKVMMAHGTGDRFYQLNAGAGAEPWKLRRMGLTTFLADVRPCVPELDPWLEQLAQEVGLPRERIRVSAFASPPGGGLPFHFDANDSLVVHIAGRKDLHVAMESPAANPLTQHTIGFVPGAEEFALFRDGFPAQPPPATVIQMKPGSAVFIPNGYWHHTVAHSETFSLSIIFEWPKAVDLLLARLRMHLIQDAGWRRPMRGAWTSSGQKQARRTMSDLLAKLPAQIAGVDPDSALQELEGHLDAQFRYVTPLTSFIRVPTISMAIRRVRDRCRVAVNATNILWRGAVQIPERLAKVCAWLNQHRKRFTSRDLATRFTIDLNEAAKLLRELTRVGAVRRAEASFDIW